ncbi:hypothetical protein [Treponema phagedenis]|nr:hypothetical protein [Treponema phagedenis]NVP24642.1 hypothetical protein [Treponema phagedenis]QKS91897.1 hypothetical protein HPJ96_04520 [Treponema phagedenis]TYT79410.1 hypothetical protein FS559_10130 [Treponema phagedenis]
MLVISIFCAFSFACKHNTDTLIQDYNNRFTTPEEYIWKKANENAKEPENGKIFRSKTYTVSKDCGLFIIGAPLNCEIYTWTLSDKNMPSSIEVIVGREMCLELPIHKDPNFGINEGVEKGEYELKLVVKKNGSFFSDTCTIIVQ